MSEFKFACPICGQHITADSKDTGSQIPCPTCFRKIVVPPAPTDVDPKFVLSASEANKPRPQTNPTPMGGIPRVPAKTSFPLALLVLLVLACAAGATLFALRGKFFHPKPGVHDATDENHNSEQSGGSQPIYSGTNRWTLDLSDAKFPDAPVSGAIHQRAFNLDRATLTGSNLTLRVGRSGPVELGLTVYFFNRQAEELSGKTAEIQTNDTIAPRVILRWKEAKRVSETFRSGYAMKIEFGPLANNAISGKIFLCLPDGSKSWVAGSFRAEVHKPSPPKPRPPGQH
jgi:DNA-directed RNA polymerase subunit RPC12/RpoP